jgi:hypothetical protein
MPSLWAYGARLVPALKQIPRAVDVTSARKIGQCADAMCLTKG